MHRVVNKDISKRLNCTILSVPGSWLSKVSVRTYFLMHNGANYAFSAKQRHVVLPQEMTHPYNVYNSMLHSTYGNPLTFDFQKGDFSRSNQSDVRDIYLRQYEISSGTNLHLPHPYHCCLLKGCPNCISFDERSPSFQPSAFNNNVQEPKYFHTDKHYHRRNLLSRPLVKKDPEKHSVQSTEWTSNKTISPPEWPEKFFNAPKKTRSAMSNGSKCVNAFLDHARDNFKTSSEPTIDPSKYLGSVRKSSNISVSRNQIEENKVVSLMQEKNERKNNQLDREKDKHEFLSIQDSAFNNKIPRETLWTNDAQCQGYVGTPHKKFQNIIPPREDRGHNLLLAGSGTRKYPNKNKKIKIASNKNHIAKNKVHEHLETPLQQKLIQQDDFCTEGSNHISATTECFFDSKNDHIQTFQSPGNNLIEKLLKPSTNIQLKPELNIKTKSSDSEMISQLIGTQRSGPTLKDGIPIYYESSVAQESQSNKKQITPQSSNAEKKAETFNITYDSRAGEKSSVEINQGQVGSEQKRGVPTDSWNKDISLQNSDSAKQNLRQESKNFENADLNSTSNEVVEVSEGNNPQTKMLQEEYYESSISKVCKSSQEKSQDKNLKEKPVDNLNTNISLIDSRNSVIEVYGSTESKSNSPIFSTAPKDSVITNQSYIVQPPGTEGGFRIVIKPSKNNENNNSAISILGSNVSIPQENQVAGMGEGSTLHLDPKNSLITLNLSDKKVTPHVLSINSSNRHIKINISPVQPEKLSNMDISRINLYQCRLNQEVEQKMSVIPRSFADLKSAVALFDRKKKLSHVSNDNTLIPLASGDNNSIKTKNISQEQLIATPIENEPSVPKKSIPEKFVKVVKIEPRKDTEYKYLTKMKSQSSKQLLNFKSEKPLFNKLSNVKTTAEYFQERRSKNNIYQSRRNIRETFIPPPVHPSRESTKTKSSCQVNKENKKMKKSISQTKLDTKISQSILPKSNLTITNSRKRKLYPEEKKLFINTDPAYSKTKNKKKFKMSNPESNVEQTRDAIEYNMKERIPRSLTLTPIRKKGNMQVIYTTNSPKEKEYYKKLKKNMSTSSLKTPNIDSLKPRQYFSLPYSTSQHSISHSKNSELSSTRHFSRETSKHSSKNWNNEYENQLKSKHFNYTIQFKSQNTLKKSDENKKTIQQTVLDKKDSDLPLQTYEVICSQYKRKESSNDLHAMRAALLNEQRIKESAEMMNTTKQIISPRGTTTLIKTIRPKVSKLMTIMKNKLQWQQMYQSGKETYENIKTELSRLPAMLDLKAGKKGTGQKRNKSVETLSSYTDVSGIEKNDFDSKLSTFPSRNNINKRVLSSPNLGIVIKAQAQTGAQNSKCTPHVTMKENTHLKFHYHKRKMPTTRNDY